MANELETKAINVIRGLAMDAVQKANSGHPGTAMALAPLAHVLFTRIMRYDAAEPDWPDRDRFILSAGHASMLLYGMLYLTGYGLTLDDIKQFRQWGSRTAGHPEYGHAAGIEVTTGPLGQGFANGVGMAIAEANLRARFGADVCDHRIFAICSDGDLSEGVSHEAASLAGHLGLGRLIYVYDDNHITIDGETELAYSDDAARRFEAYGWHVEKLGEVANDTDALEAALRRAADVEDRPSLLVLRSHIGWPSPEFTDTAEAHGNPLGEDEVRRTKGILGLPPDETFWVPEKVPGIVGGGGDLTGNTGTALKGFGVQSSGEPGGRQIYFGVREHGMGSALNGMALHGGVIPVGGTFFVFSDYMKPAVRLAAISEAKSIFVFTHDSVGLGEDGPTHQPIEHPAALRAVPRLRLIRPADANETAVAWRIALSSDGPTALILTRQNLPVLAGTAGAPVERGVRGITSNPTIFQKAIAGSDRYDDQFGDLARSGMPVDDAYWDMVVDDIEDALRILRPVHDESDGVDGYVSLEVAPDLARDRDATIASAKDLHDRIAEPNLFVKVPATAEGVEAIRALIGDGRSINVTLIFGLDRYAEVIEAYLSGLEAYQGDLSQIASVASFFVSRVDTEVDRRLEAIGPPEAPDLRGKAAAAPAQPAH